MTKADWDLAKRYVDILFQNGTVEDVRICLAGDGRYEILDELSELAGNEFDNPGMDVRPAGRILGGILS